MQVLLSILAEEFRQLSQADLSMTILAYIMLIMHDAMFGQHLALARHINRGDELCKAMSSQSGPCRALDHACKICHLKMQRTKAAQKLTQKLSQDQTL